jgi:ABC-type transport system involved in cytochrome c biogenesis permease subunit
MPRFNIFLALLAVLLLVPRAQAAERVDLDFSAWQHMPAFHNGRMMPVNTFARIAVEKITDRANPKLALAGTALSGGTQPAALAEARELFSSTGSTSDAPVRKFTSAELLFSWLAEPQRWEAVPFLIAEHEELRKEVLGLPVLGEDGQHLKYVSPAQVQGAEKFRTRLMEVVRKQQAAQAAGQKPALSAVERKTLDLYEAFSLYRLITFDPTAAGANRSRFLDRLSTVMQTWRDIQPSLQQIATVDSSGLGQEIGKVSEAIGKLGMSSHDGGIALEEIEPAVADLAQSASSMATLLSDFRRRLTKSAPPMLSPEQVREFRTQIHVLAARAADLSRQANEAHLALYDNGNSLRLVPALNAAALEKNRDTEDDAQPWLNVQTLLHGSKAVLRGYPAEQVEQVHKTFQEAVQAYAARGAADRPKRFSAAMDQFAAVVRSLGEGIESTRRELPIQQKDIELIAATAYPPIGSTDTEVHYYELDPFFWSWLVGALALVAFALSFGRLRKPMFWLGLGILGLAQLFTIYGLTLRVLITGWAPVTNMFETVIFVALVVALLGIWFTLLPALSLGLRTAWRLNAIPGTPEATPPDEEQARLFGPEQWRLAGWLLFVPRLLMAAAVAFLLTGVKYGTGEGYSVVALWPRMDVGASVPTLGNVLVWLVGMALLLAAVWLVPRLAITLSTGLFTVPYAWAKLGAAKPLAGVLGRKPFAIAGGTVALLAALAAYYAPGLDKGINPLMPVLRDNFWLTIHVLTITASYGAGFLAWGLGLTALGHYLFGRYRPAVHPSPATLRRFRPAPGVAAHADDGKRAPEACDTLGGYIYKATQVAVLLLAAGTILGGLWADVSWGRFWGWDSKEVWALVSCLIYLAILHGRYAGWFGNFGLAVGSVFGATSILMAWYGVNFVLGSGLHSYGEGTGGWMWAMGLVALNWIFVGLAAFRYSIETTPASRRDEPSDAADDADAEKETISV